MKRALAFGLTTLVVSGAATLPRDGTAACALEALENAQRMEMLITRVRIPQGNQTASLWL